MRPVRDMEEEKEDILELRGREAEEGEDFLVHRVRSIQLIKQKDGPEDHQENQDILLMVGGSCVQEQEKQLEILGLYVTG